MGEIEKQTPDDVASLLLSFNDVNLASRLFEQNGWSFTEEIREVLFLVKQNQNLATKLSAIKFLRQIVKETMEAAGMIGNITRRVIGENGDETVFSAKHIARALNPTTKQITSIQKEKQNEQTKQGTSDFNSECTGDEGRGDGAGTDDGRTHNGSIERGEPDGQTGIGTVPGGASAGTEPGETEVYAEPPRDGETDDPCVEHRPPTCSREMYPGVAGNTPTTIPPEE